MGHFHLDASHSLRLGAGLILSMVFGAFIAVAAAIAVLSVLSGEF